MNAEKVVTEIALGFLESLDLREHLRVNGKKYYADGNLPFEVAIALITSSRHSLEKKISSIKSISNLINSLKDDRLDKETDWINGIVKAGEFALSETTQNITAGIIFTLTAYMMREVDWFYADGNYTGNESAPHTSFESAMDCLIEDMNEDYQFLFKGDSSLKHYEITKWIPAQDGEMQKIVTWHLSNDGVVYMADINNEIEHLRELSEYGDCLSNQYSLFNQGLLPLPLPFSVGDIVTIDYRPHAKVFHAVISETSGSIGNVHAMYMTEYGELLQQDVTHDFSDRILGVPVFSCLHRIEKFTGQLSAHEIALYRVSETLKSNPTLGNPDSKENDEFIKDFNGDIMNFIPLDLNTGDIVRVRQLCYSCGADGVKYYALVLDVKPNDVDVIFYYSDRYHKIRESLCKTTLKQALGNVARYSFEKCSADNDPDKHEPEYDTLKELSEILQADSSNAEGEDFLNRLITEHSRVRKALRESYQKIPSNMLKL